MCVTNFMQSKILSNSHQSIERDRNNLLTKEDVVKHSADNEHYHPNDITRMDMP